MDGVSSDPKILITSHQQYDSPDVLTPSSVLSSPLDQFRTWFASAVAEKVQEPEAVALSTSTASGVPSTRFVLFKQLDARGFVFFTNYESRKSREIEENPYASLAFYWREVHRQVRIVGRVEKVARKQSEEYFQSRPIGSQLGAWASPQSQIVGKDDVKARLVDIEEKFGVQSNVSRSDIEIPLPEFWGGWRVVPDEIEFWAGKPSRLHDRVRYLRVEGSSEDAPEWQIDRLAP